ncbi:MAG: DNA primase [Acholeplasmataceae bacterium]
MDKSIIDQINEKTDIVGLVSEFVDLAKTGKNYKGLCPFHDEKTPSFSVSPEKNIAKCMGCGEGGNPINFYRKIKNITRNQAIAELGQRLGIEVSTTPVKKDPHENDYRLMAEVAQFYQFNLSNTENGQKALSYLKKRQMTEQAIKHFKIGYAPPFGNDVYRLLKDKGYQTTDMLALGIIKQDQKGEYYDLFSDRIIFPITNKDGHVVGFSGRTIQPKEQVKYINSPETPIFKKGFLLYHLFEALSDIRKQKHVVLFEGFFDVISAYGADIKSGVATMGTALTKNQAQLIKQVTDAVIICYDGDEAGLKATDQAITVLEKERLKVNVLIVPEAMDPDDFIKAYGPEAFEKLFGEHLLDPYAFRYISYKKSSNLKDAHDMQSFKKNVLAMLRYADESIKQFYIKKLSTDLNIDPLSLSVPSAPLPIEQKPASIPKKSPQLIIIDKYFKAEIYLIMMMLTSKQHATYIHNHLKVTESADSKNGYLRVQINSYYQQHDILVIDQFLDQQSTETREHMQQHILKNMLWSDAFVGDEKLLDAYIDIVKNAGKARRFNYLIDQLKTSPTDDPRRSSWVIEKDDLQFKLKHKK